MSESAESADSEPQTVPTNRLKKQLRDLRRLLSRPGLADDVKASKQAQMDEILTQLSSRGESSTHAQPKPEISEKKASASKKPSVDYKKIRFIEKNKIQKKIGEVQKKLRKLSHDILRAADVNPPLTQSEIDALSASKQETQAQLNELEGDMLYVVHFPKDEKYISLFPRVPYTSEEVIKKQAEIRQQVLAAHSVQEVEQKLKTRPLALLQEKKEERKARKELVRQLKAGETEGEIALSSVTPRQKKPQPAASAQKLKQTSSARIKRDEESSSESDGETQNKSRPKQKKTKKQPRKAARKDDFFLAGDDDAPSGVAPQEFLADLRPIGKNADGVDSDNSMEEGGDDSKKRKRPWEAEKTSRQQAYRSKRPKTRE